MCVQNLSLPGLELQSKAIRECIVNEISYDYNTAYDMNTESRNNSDSDKSNDTELGSIRSDSSNAVPEAAVQRHQATDLPLPERQHDAQPSSPTTEQVNPLLIRLRPTILRSRRYRPNLHLRRLRPWLDIRLERYTMSVKRNRQLQIQSIPIPNPG